MREFARLPLRKFRGDRLTIDSLVRRHHTLLVHRHWRAGGLVVSVGSEDSGSLSLSDRDCLVFCAVSGCSEQSLEVVSRPQRMHYGYS